MNAVELNTLADGGEMEAVGYLSATLLAHFPGMIYRCRNDLARTFEFASPGAFALFGLKPQALVEAHASFDMLICREDRDRIRQEIRAAVAQGNSFTGEYRILYADGRRRHVWEQSCTVRNEKGEVVAWEGFVTDITARIDAACAKQEQEYQFRLANNLKSINALARGVAHDFNNIMAGILSSAELIQMDSTSENPTHEFLGHIFETGERAREMIQHLREFSQRKPAARTLIPLPPVLGECLQSLRSIIPDKVEIAHSYAHNCPPVFADAAQIQQAVTQLCLYAWHLLPPQKGRIHVRLDTCKIELESASNLCAGSYVRISILDNGRDLRKSEIDRFFEPFAFKTAGDKKSGLELFMVQEIIREHGGAVTVESKPGEGTVFQLYFPVPM